MYPPINLLIYPLISPHSPCGFPSISSLPLTYLLVYILFLGSGSPSGASSESRIWGSLAGACRTDRSPDAGSQFPFGEVGRGKGLRGSQLLGPSCKLEPVWSLSRVPERRFRGFAGLMFAGDLDLLCRLTWNPCTPAPP